MDSQLIRRRRPAKSCIECRRRKIKCDRNDPCQHCIAAKSRCTYKLFRTESINYQQPTPISLHASSPVDRRQDIDTPERLNEYATDAPPLRPTIDTTAATGVRLNDPPTIALVGNYARSNGHLEGTDINMSTDVETSTIRDLLQQVQKLEQFSLPSSEHRLAETPRDIVAQQFGLQGSQLILMKSRIMRWSHLMFMAKEVRLQFRAAEFILIL
jgi:hypothetical protein